MNEKTKNLIDAIKRELMEDSKCWVGWYPNVFKDLESTDPFAIMDLDGIDEYDNAYFTQGWVQGMRDAQRIIREVLKGGV